VRDRAIAGELDVLEAPEGISLASKWSVVLLLAAYLAAT